MADRPTATAYPAVVDGKIAWIIDGYTTLEDYPYAQRSSLDGLVEDSIEPDDRAPHSASGGLVHP